jgi:hypothetical protein
MNKITAAENGQAPRMLAAWQAMTALLADGDWHGADDLISAAIETGIARRTAENMLDDATSRGRRFQPDSIRLRKQGRGYYARYGVSQ